MMMQFYKIQPPDGSENLSEAESVLIAEIVRRVSYLSQFVPRGGFAKTIHDTLDKYLKIRTSVILEPDIDVLHICYEKVLTGEVVVVDVDLDHINWIEYR